MNKERTIGQLIKNSKYSNNQQGIWLVKGEDSNPDLHGHHHMPTLGYFEGQYADVVEFAVNLKGFYAWGSGGSVELISVQTVDPQTAKKLEEANRELRKLKETEESLKERIRMLGGDV